MMLNVPLTLSEEMKYFMSTMLDSILKSVFNGVIVEGVLLLASVLVLFFMIFLIFTLAII